MGSPETCPTCGSKPGYRSGPFCLGSHPDKWHETHRDPTPTGRIYPDCTCAWKVPDVRCPWHGNATPPAPAPDAGARIEEAHRALGKPGRMDDDGCCVGCGRSVQPSPCCPDFPVWPGPCRSCYAYDEEQRDAGAAEDHPSEASRDHGAEGSDRAVVEAVDAYCIGIRDPALRGKEHDHGHGERFGVLLKAWSLWKEGGGK